MSYEDLNNVFFHRISRNPQKTQLRKIFKHVLKQTQNSILVQQSSEAYIESHLNVVLRNG